MYKASEHSEISQFGDFSETLQQRRKPWRRQVDLCHNVYIHLSYVSPNESLYRFYFLTADGLALGKNAESDEDSESDCEVGAQAPPLTKQISNILNRYPEGGQILKVRAPYFRWF